MATSYIAVGSNLGDRKENLKTAKDYLEKIEGIQFLKSSSVYETEPVGGPPQGKYLNAVWKVETSLEPKQLLEKLLGIEAQMGRIRKEKNGPRPIDLDILFYEDRILHESDLEIPHPQLQTREFVLKPLMDLAPDFVHPELKKTVREMYETLI
jgi:2-amino-4-hydroxy-6-hydroxymethyldihydropteridine diphosphokinase